MTILCNLNKYFIDKEYFPENQCAHTGIMNSSTWKLCHNHTNAGVACRMNDQYGEILLNALE